MKTLRHLSILGLLGLVPLSASVGQSEPRLPAGYAGVLFQGNEFDSETGWLAGISAGVRLTRLLSLVPAAEFVHTHIYNTKDVCVFGGEQGCFGRPRHESLLYLSASLEISRASRHRLRPFIEAGPALALGLGPKVAGERHSFVAPQIGLGVAAPSHRGTWQLALRWRRLDRWSDRISPGTQLALRLAFQPGRER